MILTEAVTFNNFLQIKCTKYDTKYDEKIVYEIIIFFIITIIYLKRIKYYNYDLARFMEKS